MRCHQDMKTSTGASTARSHHISQASGDRGHHRLPSNTV